MPLRTGVDLKVLADGDGTRSARNFDFAGANAQARLTKLQADIDKLNVILGPGANRVFARSERYFHSGLDSAEDFQDDAFKRLRCVHGLTSWISLLFRRRVRQWKTAMI